MSWSFSPVLVAAFSEACCSDTERSAQSNTTPMPDQYYWPDKPTEHSRLSRFGMTSAPLTADRGEELLTWFLADSRARTSASREQELESVGPGVDFGQKWHGSFAKYDQSSSAWKTAQCSLVEDLEWFSETWPRWGSMRNGVSYLRQIPALPICASGSGLWPTPTVVMSVTTPEKFRARQLRLKERHAGRTGNGCGPSLAQAVVLYPTPTATDYKGSPSPQKVQERMAASSRGVRLPEQLARVGSVGPLNPNWVEWLMGWPIGWTDLKPLETARFQEWLQQHGIS
jgi:hypothetical protein